MNKLFTGLLLTAFIFLQACEGPAGPPGEDGIEGPAGPPGEDGVNIVGEAMEMEVDFTSENDYLAIFDLDPPILESDVMIAFIEWEMVDGTSVWRQLPQIFYHNEGDLQYNFDFTTDDFSLFLETTFDPGLLGAEWTENQYFRVVIVPADFVGRISDDTGYNELIELIGINEEDFKTISPGLK